MRCVPNGPSRLGVVEGIARVWHGPTGTFSRVRGEGGAQDRHAGIITAVHATEDEKHDRKHQQPSWHSAATAQQHQLDLVGRKAAQQFKNFADATI